MELEETTEMQLIKSWRSGDRHSGDRLLRRYVPLLRSYFSRRVTRNVDELVQRTLFACVEAVSRFEGKSSFKSYLLGIAHHQFLMSLRSDPRGLESKTLPMIQETPSQLVALRQEQFLIVSALMNVEREYLDVLKRYYWDGLSVEEIGAELAVPVGTVKSRLARGRAALKQNLSSLPVRANLRDEALKELAQWLGSRAEPAQE